jgi:hypothetical protein
MQTYVRKPFTIQAVQLTQAAVDAGEIPGDGVQAVLAGPTHPRTPEGQLDYAVVRTPEGDATAFPGWWIIEVDGVLGVLSDERFHAAFEAA